MQDWGKTQRPRSRPTRSPPGRLPPLPPRRFQESRGGGERGSTSSGLFRIQDTLSCNKLFRGSELVCFVALAGTVKWYGKMERRHPMAEQPNPRHERYTSTSHQRSGRPSGLLTSQLLIPLSAWIVEAAGEERRGRAGRCQGSAARKGGGRESIGRVGLAWIGVQSAKSTAAARAGPRRACGPPAARSGENPTGPVPRLCFWYVREAPWHRL